MNKQRDSYARTLAALAAEANRRVRPAPNARSRPPSIPAAPKQGRRPAPIRL